MVGINQQATYVARSSFYSKSSIYYLSRLFCAYSCSTNARPPLAKVVIVTVTFSENERLAVSRSYASG